MENMMLTNVMGAMGRGGDAMMAHVTPGDVVIPRDVVLSNPEFLTKFKKAMQDMGGDYRSHIVGSGYENQNPETGAPEFFFSGWKGFGKKIMPYITGNPILGIDLLGANTPAPSAPSMPSANLGGIEKEFTPVRPDEVSRPASLTNAGGQDFGELDPTQQRSYLATQGAYGSGLGDEEKNYYLNQLQRNLMSSSGQLGNINEALMPIERNYLSRIGLPTDDTTAFFKALQT